MTTTSVEQLEQEIERLVRAHVAACRRAAEAAVARGFGSASAPSGKRAPTPSSRRSRASGTGRRRTAAEMEAVAERLYEAVCAHPGEMMSVLAPQVGATAAQLHRPMNRLKKLGRVRSIGSKHQTRYFPLTE